MRVVLTLATASNGAWVAVGVMEHDAFYLAFGLFGVFCAVMGTLETGVA